MKGCQFDDRKLRLKKDCFVNPQSRSTRLVAASNVKFHDLYFCIFYIYFFQTNSNSVADRIDFINNHTEG